ncbi:MAG: outer membrane beta-barrel protein, partial [Vicinamibacterales bacterium]
ARHPQHFSACASSLPPSVRRAPAVLIIVNRWTSIVIGACLWALAAPTTLLAQSAEDEGPPPKFIFGPVGLTPRIALRDVGVDTNPLNQAGESTRDFTFTLEPGLDSALRIGRGRLTAKTSVEWLYYNDASSQRSVNLNQEARAELVLNRVRPYVFGAYLRTRQRPTPEIDERVQQNTTNAGVGTRLLVGSRFRFDVEARRTQYEFGDGDHGDDDIANALNRDSDAGSLITRFVLTPLTTFIVRSEVQRDRFEFSPVRDNNSISVVPGFELKPSALISGLVLVGFRSFDPVDASVPNFAGLVGRVDAQHILRESTLFSLQADRDVVYSIETEQPYYVQNGARLSMTQVLGLHWYVVGRIGGVRLAYRDFVTPAAGSDDASSDRIDRVSIRGFGIGRRLGDDLRIGFDVNYVQRRSTIAASEYEGYRFGGSISYGLQTR